MAVIEEPEYRSLGKESGNFWFWFCCWCKVVCLS